jgi:hypothetical protein
VQRNVCTHDVTLCSPGSALPLAGIVKAKCCKQSCVAHRPSFTSTRFSGTTPKPPSHRMLMVAPTCVHPLLSGSLHHVVVCRTASYFAETETVENDADAKDFKRKTSLLAYEGEADAELIGYNVVFARPLNHLPIAPADHERSPTLDEVTGPVKWRWCLDIATGDCSVFLVAGEGSTPASASGTRKRLL